MLINWLATTSTKIDLSSDTSFWDILTNPNIVTLTKKGKILGKIPLPISLFTYYSLKVKFVPFLKSEPATIPRKRKTIKWATKPPIKKKK